MRSPRTRVRPSLEHLEDRTVPATVRLVSDNLLVSNPLIVDGRASVTLQATANNTFQVVDTEGGTGSVTLGTFTVAGNIIVSGNNANDSITVNLNGHSYAGNVLLNGGNGNDSLVVTGAANATSVIGGNVTLLHGAGNASVSVNPTINSTLTIGGSVTADNTTNAYSTFQLGNVGNSINSTFIASSPTTVGGNVTLTGFSDNGTTPGVQIGAGQQDSIGGNLGVTNTGNNNATVVLGAAVLPINSFQDDVGVTLGGNVSVQEGNGNDTFTILGSDRINPAINLGTTINGNTNVKFGDGNDIFNVAGTINVANAGQQTTFNGNVTYRAGNGNDSLNLAGGLAGTGVGTRVNGNLTIQLGNGNNDFGDAELLGGNNGGLDHSEPVVTGDLNITAGNGNNVMDALGITVQGNMNFNFGNGVDGTAAVPILIRRAPGGTINWTSGNGSAVVELATLFTPTSGVGPQAFQVNVHFGNGDDTFELGTANPALQSDDTIGGTLSGLVDGGNGTNVFYESPNGAYTLEPNFTLSNFS